MIEYTILEVTFLWNYYRKYKKYLYIFLMYVNIYIYAHGIMYYIHNVYSMDYIDMHCKHNLYCNILFNIGEKIKILKNEQIILRGKKLCSRI